MALFIGNVNGHAILGLPPARSSAWRFGYNTPVNTNDYGIYCGGLQVKVKVYVFCFSKIDYYFECT